MDTTHTGPKVVLTITATPRELDMLADVLACGVQHHDENNTAALIVADELLEEIAGVGA